MKYILLQGDGMADLPLDQLGGKTPLEAADTPNMNRLAANAADFGLFRPIPPGFPAGSDVGNLVLMGYNPAEYFTGRSPLEAAAMGIELSPTDIAFRCNLVTLAENENGDTVMDDYAAGHIDTATAAEMIGTLQAHLGCGPVDLYPGVSFRHLLVWHGGTDSTRTTPPHDILSQPIAEHMPTGKGADFITDMFERSRKILADHPANKKLREAGKKEVSAIWLWGQGRRPQLPTLGARFSISGAVISAVDLVRGIGALAGMEIIEVPGATGFVDTNYEGKAEYALAALRRHDLVFLHVEAPDESAHSGDAELKIRAIEDFDRRTIGPLLDGLNEFDHYRIWLTSDHATLISTRTHSADPVAYAIYDSAAGFARDSINFCESTAGTKGSPADDPLGLFQRLLDRRENSA